ncbi:MAG: peptide chain release factor N(5)-glutamine methyltransferase [Deltaproteobacteria bacterium]|nr:peptide chain release factor N(5)-glutamine methyltransferase [Deltaproteobacteria bacterium]
MWCFLFCRLEVESLTDETWTVLKIIQWTTGYLKGKGIDNPRLDSEALLAYLLKLDRVGLYLNFDRPLSKDELSSFREIVKRRGSREPLQHITGRQEFWSLDFKVTPDVLIPRPETEILVEEAVKVVSGQGSGASENRPEGTVPDLRTKRSGVVESGLSPLRILDLCAGSGCIGISLAHELKNSVVYAVDTSEAALSIAKENAALNGVNGRVCFLLGDLYMAIKSQECSKSAFRIPHSAFDIIVSNPPYVKTGDIPNIQPEVRDYEPRMAVDGGTDGLDFYRRIVGGASGYLVPGGWLLMEVGEGQGGDVAGMVRETGGFNPALRVNDLAGIERVVKARKL